ncbi:hypothetical protein [Chryseobacterium sp. RR2-3-20]|uniref:hypothetical protein n=1 Tax=Chryseobacterium sp. RR2-3-20 TaxID=2787626 RepID=UPI001AE0C08E|nr:hypothetical protein [Chryseobacterium sp. RR2-3-20]
MSEKYQLKETAPFVQFSSVKVTDAFNDLFDIEAIPKQSLEDYCQQILNKIFSLPLKNIPAFIAHHCNLVKKPLLWLNKFEKLIELNIELFSGTRNQSRLLKIYTCLETKREKLESQDIDENKIKPAKKYINAESEERYFSFYEVQKEVDRISTDREKILFLTREKFAYERAIITVQYLQLPLFPKECDKLINEIETLAKLQEEEKSTELSGKSTVDFFKKVKTNLKVNQLVDIFIQLQREYFVDSRPAIEAENSEIVQLICNNFTDKDGNSISPQTVKTIMMPSKPEKRPKGSNIVDISKHL